MSPCHRTTSLRSLTRYHYVDETVLSEYRRLQQEYLRREARVVAEAAEIATTYSAPIYRCAELIGTVDVLAAFACASIDLDMRRPETAPPLRTTSTSAQDLLQDTVFMELRGFSNPLLLKTIGPARIVRNDVRLFHARHFAGLVTGANDGGKTTFLKGVLLLVAMHQLGSFLPASRAVLPIFRHLFVFEAAQVNDCARENKSSFLAEMTLVGEIVSAVHEIYHPRSVELQLGVEEEEVHSLIMVDELGRGTSMLDGFGLACAILEQLVSMNFTASSPDTQTQNETLTAVTSQRSINFHRKVALLCATHMYELVHALLASTNITTDITDSDNGNTAKRRRIDSDCASPFFALHLKTNIIDDSRGSSERLVSMLYEVCEGVNEHNESFGVDLAARCHYPDQVIHYAREYMHRTTIT